MSHAKLSKFKSRGYLMSRMSRNTLIFLNFVPSQQKSGENQKLRGFFQSKRKKSRVEKVVGIEYREVLNVAKVGRKIATFSTRDF